MTMRKEIPITVVHVNLSCEKYCHNLDHERVPNCYNCKIDGDCSGLNRHWQHCILYNCDACAIRDNLVEIFSELTRGKDNIHIIYYTLNKFFALLYCYWDFGQPDRKKHDEYYDHLNLIIDHLIFLDLQFVDVHGTYTDVN